MINIMNLCRITHDNNLWKKGQKVWVCYYTGDLSYKVIGRFRGKGRWIMGWVHVDVPDEYTWHHKKPNAKWIGQVAISEDFSSYLLKIARRILKNEFAFQDGF